MTDEIDLSSFPLLRYDQLPGIDTETLHRAMAESKELWDEMVAEEAETGSKPALLDYLDKQLRQIDSILEQRARNLSKLASPSVTTSSKKTELSTPSPRAVEFKALPLPSELRQTKSQQSPSSASSDLNSSRILTSQTPRLPMSKLTTVSNEDLQKAIEYQPSSSKSNKTTPRVLQDTPRSNTGGKPPLDNMRVQKNQEELARNFGSTFIVAATDRKVRFYPKKKPTAESIEETKENERLERRKLAIKHLMERKEKRQAEIASLRQLRRQKRKEERTALEKVAADKVAEEGYASSESESVSGDDLDEPLQLNIDDKAIQSMKESLHGIVPAELEESEVSQVAAAVTVSVDTTHDSDNGSELADSPCIVPSSNGDKGLRRLLQTSSLPSTRHSPTKRKAKSEYAAIVQQLEQEREGEQELELELREGNTTQPVEEDTVYHSGDGGERVHFTFSETAIAATLTEEDTVTAVDGVERGQESEGAYIEPMGRQSVAPQSQSLRNPRQPPTRESESGDSIDLSGLSGTNEFSEPTGNSREAIPYVEELDTNVTGNLLDTRPLCIANSLNDIQPSQTSQPFQPQSQSQSQSSQQQQPWITNAVIDNTVCGPPIAPAISLSGHRAISQITNNQPNSHTEGNTASDIFPAVRAAQQSVNSSQLDTGPLAALGYSQSDPSTATPTPAGDSCSLVERVIDGGNQRREDSSLSPTEMDEVSTSMTAEDTSLPSSVTPISSNSSSTKQLSNGSSKLSTKAPKQPLATSAKRTVPAKEQKVTQGSTSEPPTQSNSRPPRPQPQSTKQSSKQKQSIAPQLPSSLSQYFPHISRILTVSQLLPLHKADSDYNAKLVLEQLHSQHSRYRQFIEIMRDYDAVYSQDALSTPSGLYYRVNASQRPEVSNIISDVLRRVARMPSGLQRDIQPLSSLPVTATAPLWIEFPSSFGLGLTWNLLWTWSKPHIDHSQLLVWQKINHFQDSRNLTRKDFLKKSIQRYVDLCKDKTGKLAQVFDIMPNTFILPHEYVQFVEAFGRQQEKVQSLPQASSSGSSSGNISTTLSGAPPTAPPTSSQYNYWIMKPVGLSRGRGISLINDISSVVYSQSSVIQQYLDNPLLLNGYKFDLRLYVLVTSFQPLEAWIYRDGFGRLSTFLYSNSVDSLQNKLIHLTNSSIQKYNTGDITGDNPLAASQEKESSGSKLPLLGEGGVWEKLQIAYPQCNIEEIWGKICMLVMKSLFVVDDKIGNQPNAFEVFGYDVFLDNDFRPWLIEVNSSPSLARENALDYRIKEAMIYDTIMIVNPPAFDREALLNVLERRLHQSGSNSSNSSSNSRKDIQLEEDILAIVGEHYRPRQVGEPPVYTGQFEKLSPDTKYSEYMNKIKSRFIKPL